MRKKFRKAKPKKDESKKFPSNRQIRAERVFLIDENEEKAGEMPISEALARAQEVGLDLVEVNPKADPPVAKILDLGRWKYEMEKKAHKQKQQQKKIETKGIRLSVRISKHDFDVRVVQAVKFLKKGHKLKVELTLKGREKQHPAKAKEVIDSFVAEVEKDPEIETREEQPLTRQGGKYIIVLINK
ncbi:MAG: translation initiation factor IF-3 [Patescibacteria group bacterium]